MRKVLSICTIIMLAFFVGNPGFAGEAEKTSTQAAEQSLEQTAAGEDTTENDDGVGSGAPEVSDPEEEADGGEAAWTFIYYLAADNEQEYYADNTIAQLLAGTANHENHPQILVLVDRLSTAGTEVFEIAGGEIVPVASYEEQNTADGVVLQGLAADALARASHDKVAFVMKSEGFAWRGIGRDNSHAEELDDQLMSNGALPEALVAAQAAAGSDVDLLVLEGSTMAFFEVVWELRDAAPVLVASQSKILEQGLPWEMVIGDLAATPDMSAIELGTAITKDHIAFYDEEGTSGDISSEVDTYENFAALTVFDQSYVREALATQSVLNEATWRHLDEIYTYLAHARDLSAVGGYGHVTTNDYQHDIETTWAECIRLMEEEGGLVIEEINDAFAAYMDVSAKHIVLELSSDEGAQLEAANGLSLWYPPTWLAYETRDECEDEGGSVEEDVEDTDDDDDEFASDYWYEDPAIGLDFIADSNWLTFLFEYFDRADAELEGTEDDEPAKTGVFDKIEEAAGL